MTFEQFLQKVDKFYHDNKPHLRYGQTIMNILYNVCPKKYNTIKGSDYDCFYDDTLVQATLFKLEKEWVDNVTRT